MKKVFLYIVFSLLLTSAGAQSSYVGINLGTSIPGTDMAGNDNLLNRGFAVSGFSIEFDGVYFPGSVFGVGAMLGFGSYYTQQDAYFDNLRDYLNTHPQLAGFSLPLRDEVSYSAGFWNFINIMVGPELSVPFWDFQLGIRAMGGTSVIISPKREMLYDSTLETAMAETSGTDLSLSYLYGASLMYFLSSGTSIRIKADYFYSKADYNFNVDVETPIADLSESSKERVEINTLQLSIGLSYAF